MTPLGNLFGAGHRVFFLAAGLFGTFAMLVWELHLAAMMLGSAAFSERVALPPLWHGHEMVFGYGVAALGGYLLMAPPPFVRGAPQGFLALAFALWLLGRVALWFAPLLPPVLVAAADLAFLLLLAGTIAAREIRRPKGQNRVFLAAIATIWIGNLLVHLEWNGVGLTALGGLRLGILGLCALIAVLGGRLTPGFTRNAMKRAGADARLWPRSPAWIERPALLLVAALPAGQLLFLPDSVLGTLAVAAGAAHLRLSWFWRPLFSRHEPILWALHMGVTMLGAGFVLWGLSLLGLGDEIAALHVLGIGAIGGMTLAVMSRTILGHAGREQIAPAPVAAAYGLVAGAAILRWLAMLLPPAGQWGAMLLSGACWTVAFALFTLSLGPVLAATRAERTTRSENPGQR